MLRFGSASAFNSQSVGNLDQANPSFDKLIKRESGRKLSSPCALRR